MGRDRLRKPVVAREQDATYHQVVGGFDKEILYGRVLPKLPREEWFRTGDLAREVFSASSRRIIPDMHRDGLLLCNEIQSGREGFLYRTLV